MASMKVLLLATLLVAGAISGSRAQRVTNACEQKCSWDLEPLCVRHYDTNCKPSWWGNLDRCMCLKKSQLRTRVMPNRCKYECIKEQFAWEAWTELDKPVKLNKWCQKQWKDFGFSAHWKCQKC